MEEKDKKRKRRFAIAKAVKLHKQQEEKEKKEKELEKVIAIRRKSIEDQIYKSAKLKQPIETLKTCSNCHKHVRNNFKNNLDLCKSCFQLQQVEITDTLDRKSVV